MCTKVLICPGFSLPQVSIKEPPPITTLALSEVFDFFLNHAVIKHAVLSFSKGAGSNLLHILAKLLRQGFTHLTIH